MMRWSLMKKAWGLARERFGGVRRLFVDIPARVRQSGTLHVFDLDSPDKPVGALSYKVVSSSDPHIAISVLEAGEPRYMVANAVLGALGAEPEKNKRKWNLEVTEELPGSQGIALAKTRNPLTFAELREFHSSYGRDVNCGDRSCFVVRDTKDGSSHLMWSGDDTMYELSKGAPSVVKAMTARAKAPRCSSVSFDVESSVDKPEPVSKGRVVASRYSGAELHEKLASLASTDLGSVDHESVSGWLESEGLPAEMTEPVCAALGLPSRTVLAYGKKFEEYDKVRVNAPLSMEHQECGQVLIVKGSYAEGYWYLVLVDGSSEPTWFPEESLAHIEAGKPEEPR